MAAEEHNGGRSPSENPTRVDRSLDELARDLATSNVSRGRVLKIMGGALLGSVLAAVPGVAWADDRCSEGQTRCGDRCVNLQTNERHCGSCRNRCASNQTCCKGRCVNLQRNERHCGSCFNRCPEGIECVGGVCQCPSGTTLCGGNCVPNCPSGQTLNPTTCACEGGACETFVCGDPAGQCAGGPDPPDRCFCFEVTETPGQGRCLNDFMCDTALGCPNGTTDCPTGFTCVTNTCCGLGVQLCAPECGVVGVTSQGGGPTASGASW